jgi:hypothetical protein
MFYYLYDYRSSHEAGIDDELRLLSVGGKKKGRLWQRPETLFPAEQV